MALQHWKFVNAKGKPFKTTTSEKARYLNDKKLGCVLIGECDEKGVLKSPESLPKEPSKETTQAIKQILEASKEPVKETQVIEVKFSESEVQKIVQEAKETALKEFESKPKNKNVKTGKK